MSGSHPAWSSSSATRRACSSRPPGVSVQPETRPSRRWTSPRSRRSASTRSTTCGSSPSTVDHAPAPAHPLGPAPLRRLHRQLHGLLDRDAETLPHLLLEEAVAHAHGGLEGELLALLELLGGELRVVLLQAEHAEGHVAGLVTHHIAQELLEERL